ncbi:Transmembrane channel-like protein 7 [Oopsacas minuta]|uniref:Transmembrane channel-like protein 7 n=1 Tax=Oopsacas minuta TaxID=111878 RepID=A0AAV7KLE6_9METZ|nr:Transmembrane channel-like protein 7 [Oopsacas minuta]
MAQSDSRVNLFSNKTEDTQVGVSSIETNMANFELKEVLGEYIETPADTEVIDNFHNDEIKQKESSEVIWPVTSDDIIENAPSKMLLNECKIVGIMEEFCGKDNEGVILDCDFHKKIRTVKRAASEKSFRKNKIKRVPSALTESKPPVVRSNHDHEASPVVMRNENNEFEWQCAQNGPNEPLAVIATEQSVLPRNLSTESFPNQSKNLRNRRATELLKRDEIKRQASVHGFWYTARYIHYERFKSIWHNVKSISFWGSEMKHVESIFGTSVVSYFIFLRFIFLINFVLFIIATMFIILPQLLFNYVIEFNSTLVARIRFKPQEDILGLVTGDNWFENTELFYGSYTDEIIATPKRDDPENAVFQYSMPYAYLFTNLVILLMFLIALIYKLGEAFRESYGTLGGQTSAETCNRVFGAWDYGISNEKAAKLRHHSITTDLKEEIDEQIAKNLHRSWKEWLAVIFLRIFFNILTFLLLAISGVIIVFSTLWALANRCPGEAQAQFLQPLGINIPGIINSLTIVILNFLLQFIFPFFAQYERFRTQSYELKITLVRSVLIRLASLIVLTLTLFVSYLFIQAGGDVSVSAGNTTEFNPQEVANFINGALGTTLNVTSFQCQSFSCWETYFGQEFYRLAVTNFVFAIITTLFPEISRYLLHRFGPKIWNRVSKIVKKQFIKKYADLLAKLVTNPPEFIIAKSVLDLIYAQALMLLGVFFCPFLPMIASVTFFVTFYVKKYSCVWFCSPSSRGLYRSARNNLFYILLLMLIYFASLAAILYMLLELEPSDECGPFRNFDSFVGPIEIYISRSEVAINIVDLIKSPGVTYSIITLLLLFAYAQYIIVGSYKKNVKSIRHRLGVESADKQYYCDQLVVIFNQAESLRKLHNDILQVHYNSDIEYEFVYKDRLDSITSNIGAAATGARLSWMNTNDREKLVDRRKQASNIGGIYERTDNRKH